MIYALINYFVAKIAYLYLDKSKDAQLIVLYMLSSKATRQYHGDLYNDELMFLYLIIGIYQAMKDRPMVSALFLSLSLSVKAGALLVLPAFLG